jgi:hypothetical protein
MMARAVVLILAACGGGGTTNSGGDATDGDDGAMTPADADETRPPDPNDPVQDVPAHQGAYGFGKLTVQDKTQFADFGTWFTNTTTEHRVTTVRAHITRYRDQLLFQDKNAAQVFLYDQTATTIGAAIALPSDAVGRATIRGGLVYIGGLGKVYSYELATQMWRSQPLAGAGTCHHVVAGKTRLFVMCADPSSSQKQQLFSTWANKTMSDALPLGTVSLASFESLQWITAAPGEDVAYFPSNIPSDCIGRATTTTLTPCALALNTLGTFMTARVADGRASEDGKSLFAAIYSGTSSDNDLFEIKLSSLQVQHIYAVDSFATCPDNSVVYQKFTASGRYAGGVTTAVRLGTGGEQDMGCPLAPL